MQLPNSVKLLSLAILVVPAVTALDCVNEVDHRKEYTSNGKVYKLYCNSEIKPLTPAERTSNVATPEQCADLCAQKSDCRHAFYAAKNKICFLRPPQTSIREKFFQNMVASVGNTWGWIYDREAPADTGNEGTTPGDKPGTTPGDKPGTTPGDKPGTTPGDKPGTTPGDKPGTTPGDKPGSDTGTGPAPGNQVEYDCTNNRDHKKLFSINGRTFELLCGHANYHTGYQTIPNVNSLKACAERCALDPNCGNAEYHISNGACELEPDNNPVVDPNYHLWVPKFCPDTPRAQNPVTNPPQTTDLSCPMNDGHIYEGASRRPKATRTVLISVLLMRSVPGISPPARATLEPWPDLESVSFDTAAVNNCKFYGPGSYSTIHKPGIHHHYATSPPTSAPDHFGSKRCSTECPEADGQIFASPTGENFVMSCKKRHGTTYLKDVPDRYPSFASCMTACGAVPACQSVDYEPKTENCYFSTNSKSPTIAAKAFMSAHSAGCSGACAGCADDSCKDLKKGPLGPRKYGCPANHGKPITVNGIDFQVACQHAINSHPYTQVTAGSYEKCIELCAANAACGGVNWIGTTCYHHPDNNADGSSAFVHQRADSDAYVKIPGHLYNSLSQAS
ncbi:hypothetical protein MY11210_007231 [Beauveria gryllotalpidicola]